MADWWEIAVPFASQLTGVLAGAGISVWVFNRGFKKSFIGVNRFAVSYQVTRSLKKINKKIHMRGQTKNVGLEKEIMADFELSRRVCRKTYQDSELNDLYSELYQKGFSVSIESEGQPTTPCHDLIADIIHRLGVLGSSSPK